MTASSSDTWLILVLVATLAWAVYKNYAAGAPADRSTAPPVQQALKPTIGGAPGGTPVRLADAMRLSTDTLVPRLGGAGKAVRPSAEDAKAVVDEILRRLAANGASALSVVGLPVSEARQIVDENGTSAIRISFLVYDKTRNFASKIKATAIAGKDARIYVQSLGFAAPQKPIEGGPQPFDSREVLVARYHRPDEVLRETELGPGARVQY